MGLLGVCLCADANDVVAELLDGLSRVIRIDLACGKLLHDVDSSLPNATVVGFTLVVLRDNSVRPRGTWKNGCGTPGEAPRENPGGGRPSPSQLHRRRSSLLGGYLPR